MSKDITGYDVGALLYCPASGHKSVVETIVEAKIKGPYSVAFCLEDTIHETRVQDAENRLENVLLKIKQSNHKPKMFKPLIFVRVRSPEQLKKLIIKYESVSSVIDGFILPKFYLENCEEYIAIIKKNIEKKYYYMPILESHSMTRKEHRTSNLEILKDKLEEISEYILNIRVGGNDLSGAFGLRRRVNNTIYDLKPIEDILVDVIMTFGQQYIVAGPVWEYYDGEGWEEGLRKEIEKDLLAGFVGKTVIHPNQIRVVNDMLKVSEVDFHDAKDILNWDDSTHMLVKGSWDGSRMNEYHVHTAWAKKTLKLAEIYGVD